MGFSGPTLGAAALAAVGLASFFASFTGPDGPKRNASVKNKELDGYSKAQKGDCTPLPWQVIT